MVEGAENINTGASIRFLEEIMFNMDYSYRNQLALDTIHLKSTHGISIGLFHIMQYDHIERIANVGPGDYFKNPEEVYIRMLKNVGVDIVDQYLALNPLTMSKHGYE